jgi:hypothetical protein
MRRKTDRPAQPSGETFQIGVEDSGVAGKSLALRVEPAPPPAPIHAEAEVLFDKGDFRRAYATLTGVESLPGHLASDEHFKAACLFWMGRLSEAETLCAALLEKAHTDHVAAILRQIPDLRRAQAGYADERERRALPTIHRHETETPDDRQVLRGSYRCYHCGEQFNFHSAASIVSPLPFLNPILCPHCFGRNEVFCRSLGCPHCHGRLNVNARWEGLQLICPWCRERFDRPDEEDILILHDRDQPFSFPGRSADPALSTVDQEAALSPMQFNSIREVEAQLLNGKLPPWTACYRGPYDIERPLTQVASDYFCLRRHFDPRGAYAMLAGNLAWITAPMLGAMLLGIDALMLQPSARVSDAMRVGSVALETLGWMMLMATPLRLGGWLMERAGARLSATLAALLLAVDRASRLWEGGPGALVFFLRLMILPTTLTMTLPALLGGCGRGLRMLFTALTYYFAVWPVRVALGLAPLRKRRRVLWEADRDDGFPFRFRPLSLEGLEPPIGERLIGRLRTFL